MYTAHRLFGLEYPGHVAAIQLVHLINIVLLWLLARRIKAGVIAASLGTLFFGFHMALFDVYWRPMYIFDALCATCVLTSILSYSYRRWILSFVFFWLAYKAKELAVVLPVILAAWELWLGDRRFLRLIPFFAASLSFGIQAIVASPNPDNDYTFRFTFNALQRTVPYYASRVFLMPWLGLALLILPVFVRDRRVWFGLAWACAVFAPLVFLPGRIFSAYCYLPFAGVSLAFSAIASADLIGPGLCAAFVWILLNLPVLRTERRAVLAQMDATRQLVRTLLNSAERLGSVKTIVYDSLPDNFHIWGLNGVLQYAHPGSDIRIETLAERSAADALRDPGVALLQWNAASRRLHVLFHETSRPYDSTIAIDEDSPIWQFGNGWYGREGTFRWIQPHATAYLSYPAGARWFKLEVNFGEELHRKVGPSTVSIRLDGTLLGSHTFDKPGIAGTEWALPERPCGDVKRCRIEFDVSPGYLTEGMEPRRLGIAIRSFGFAP
jgi:hypothetical protein